MKVRIVKALMNNYLCSDRIGEELEVVEDTVSKYRVINTNWLIDKDDVEIIEDDSKLNVNGAVELLQRLLDCGYDPDVEIVLKHDSVRVNAFGNTFLVSSEDSLEDICKAITLLSGAKLGN